MSHKLAFIFPGQGAQSVGMIDAFLGDFPQFAARFAQASAALDLDLLALVRSGPAEHTARAIGGQCGAVGYLERAGW